jgi:O-antigen/teichoic acid export membrane protein
VAIFATFVRVGSQFLLLPAILVYLSPEQQATWWVFLALGNFANLADFGFGPAIARVYQFFWAGAEDFAEEGLPGHGNSREPNLQKIVILNRSVQYLYSRLSLVATLLLGIVGTLYLIGPITSSSESGRMWLLWGTFLLAIGFNFMTSHWQLACQGINKVRDLQMASLASGIGYVVTALVLLKLRFGLAALVFATFVRGAIIAVLTRRAFGRTVKQGESSSSPDIEMLRRLWPNAKKFGVVSIGSYLLANGSVLISRYFLDVKTTASLGLTVQVGNFLVSFASLWLAVKWPEITILRAQGKLIEMSNVFARRLALVVLSYIAAAICVYWFGNMLLEFKGTQTQLLAHPFLITYLTYVGLQMFYVQFGALTYTENVMPFFTIGLCTGVGVLVGSLILTPIFGLWGLLVAPIIGEGVYSAWFTVRRGFQGQALNVRDFIRVGFSLDR